MRKVGKTYESPRKTLDLPLIYLIASKIVRQGVGAVTNSQGLAIMNSTWAE